jgi:hypothetical protein
MPFLVTPLREVKEPPIITFPSLWRDELSTTPFDPVPG